jgi:hypothetical protein
MSGPESLTSVSVDRLPFRLPHATAGRPKKPSRLCLDLVPLSAEVLDATFEHVADRLAARAAVMRGRTGPVTMGQSATRFGLNGVGSTNGAG